MSWRPEVQVSGEAGWNSNSLIFATEDEAFSYAFELKSRWTLVKAFRAIEVDSVENPVNYRWDVRAEKAIRLEGAIFRP